MVPWDLTDWRDDRLLKALPLSTWGNLSYDLSNNDGSSTMGWVKLEADLLRVYRNYMFGVYTSYNWRFRTRNAEYFNMQGPSIGTEINNGSLASGVEYAWRLYPERHEQTHSLLFFVSLYTSWDLRKNRR